MNLSYLSERAARLWPDRPAVIDGTQTLTFGELDERAAAFANVLVEMGLTPGDRVAVLVGNEAAWFELTIGIMKAALVRTYLNPRFSAPEITYQINHAGPKVLIVSPEYLSSIETSKLDSVESVLVIDENYEKLLAASDPVFRAIPVADDFPVEFRYTSGTTGKPKGAVLTHGQYRAHAYGMQYHCNWREDDVILHAGPLSHSSGGLVVGMLASGGSNVIQRHFDIAEMLANIERHKITTMILVPTMIYMLLDEAETTDADISSIRNIVYAAAPMSPERMARCIKVFGPVFAQTFGMTESLGPTTYLPREEHLGDGAKLKSVGRPTAFCEVMVADVDGREVPVGEIGELLTRGPLVFKEYFGDPEATAATFTEDGWFRTGDMASVDQDGYVYIVDRKKDMIISGGFNVYPAEVEHALLEHPSVVEVVVVGVSDPKWGEAVTAVVRPTAADAVTEADLISWARERVAGYKVPKSVRFSEAELPKNPNGKLLRRAVRESL